MEIKFRKRMQKLCKRVGERLDKYVLRKEDRGIEFLNYSLAKHITGPNTRWPSVSFILMLSKKEDIKSLNKRIAKAVTKRINEAVKQFDGDQIIFYSLSFPYSSNAGIFRERLYTKKYAIDIKGDLEKEGKMFIVKGSVNFLFEVRKVSNAV